MLHVQYSTVQYSTVQYSTVQYSTVQYSTVQYSTVQYSTVQYSTVQYSTVQYSTVQYSTVQYSTVQYSTVQYSTVQYMYSTVQYSTVLTGEVLQRRTANTDPEARADLRVRGFWTDSRNAFFDTRVFYPHASSYRSRSLSSLYRSFEGGRSVHMGREFSTSSMVPSPLWSSPPVGGGGGKGHEGAITVKRLASALAVKRHAPYSQMVGWLRCMLSFSLARSAIRCVRGSRSIRRLHFDHAPVGLVRAEAQLVVS